MKYSELFDCWDGHLDVLDEVFNFHSHVHDAIALALLDILSVA